MIDKSQRGLLLNILTSMLVCSWLMEMLSQLKIFPFEGVYLMPVWLISIISSLMGITVVTGGISDMLKPCKDSPDDCPRRCTITKNKDKIEGTDNEDNSEDRNIFNKS